MAQPTGTGDATPYAPPVRDVPFQVAGDPAAPPSGGPSVRPPVTPYDEPLPPEVASTAADQGLGDLVKVFRPRRPNQALVIGLLILSIALIWCIVPIYELWLLLRTPNLNARVAARRVYVFQSGLIVATSAGKSRPADLDVWRWADVSTVFQKVVNANTLECGPARTTGSPQPATTARLLRPRTSGTTRTTCVDGSTSRSARHCCHRCAVPSRKVKGSDSATSRSTATA